MTDVRFFDRAGPFPVSDIAGWIGAELVRGEPARQIADVAPLRDAGPDDIAFFDNHRYTADLEATAAAACLVARRAVDAVPAHAAVLVVQDPGKAIGELVARFYPDAMRPAAAWGADAMPDAPAVHPTARLEEGAVVEPGAVIGAEAHIGRGTRILAGSVIGRRVRIGRECSIGPNATVIHALLGDRVILHHGVGVGQDGFGFAMGAAGHRKIPQVGRVVIQDDVEIGANTTVDRGALGDTVIGEGTKIDNQVQIAHNVVVGRHCVIVAQVALGGSARLGDFVAIGGQAGVMPHVVVGDGAQVATLSAVREDLAPGGRYGGVPARPAREWLKETAALQKLAREHAMRRNREQDGRNEDDD